MVVKPTSHSLSYNEQFEYGVILNGSQTKERLDGDFGQFEYGVILNGSQTFTK